MAWNASRNPGVVDAEQADDSELATFFRDVQEEDRRRGERAKDLLKQRLSWLGLAWVTCWVAR